MDISGAESLKPSVRRQRFLLQSVWVAPGAPGCAGVHREREPPEPRARPLAKRRHKGKGKGWVGLFRLSTVSECSVVGGHGGRKEGGYVVVATRPSDRPLTSHVTTLRVLSLPVLRAAAP